MLKAIFNWFVGGKPTEQQPAPRVSPEAAPYKVEPPVVTETVKAPEPVTEKKPSGKKSPAKPRAEKKPAAAIKAPKKPRAKKAAK